MPLRIADIHAHQARAKQAGFISARTGANLHDHVALIIGVPGQKQQPHFAFQGCSVLPQGFQLFLGHRRQFRVREHFLRLVLLGRQRLIAFPRLHRRLQLGMLLEQALPPGRVSDNLRLTHRLGKLIVPLLDPLEFFYHATSHRIVSFPPGFYHA